MSDLKVGVFLNKEILKQGTGEPLDSLEMHQVCGQSNQFNKLKEEIAQLKADKADLLGALTDISNMCIGEIAMGYKLDAQSIGESIHKATGLTNPELNNLLQKHKG